ncbi:beta-phosphoglucomutase family hydrolase [Mycobacterium sp. ITM-2016-00317]|uniref:beta-phosphoglucomutase family hydrolase n=1 Tax=Mycobacterium sp. ITM-2016-00317 TaxID=2099694 RepID=UPI000D469932|nr:beta-phosphoglucomutase family hydrolase [Mycobacterium sp. ITM-2016-00317]WNG87423.1 beta-phosphoglucomutase family hydrolase [Mycobacterium sp. ITM-2016-00317]
MLGLPDSIRACLFDLDGVLTDTASVHRRAWKAMFDEYLRDTGPPDTPFVPFDAGADYERYVDGKPRLDGIRSFLGSRGLTPDDATVVELGERKNLMFNDSLHRDGVTVFEGSRRYLQAATDAGLRRAVVSSSANTAEVLALTGLDVYVEARVDGVTLGEENLPGKPAPDSFLRAAELLDVAPAEAAVFEDALSGVTAGRAGGFGLVVGVDRTGQSEALRDNGADIVVTDLGELLRP